LEKEEQHTLIEYEPTTMEVEIDGETWAIVDAPEDLED
jgi:hypothetical protein